ncbi:MAG: hypothetical protein GEU74_00320 [Nitriliruptorales bacterium]|nr:hypothetical protein [Nitriliruptorales bacterium]
MSPRSRRRGSGGSASSRNRRKQNRSRSNQQRHDGAGFWGNPSKLPAPREDVRITDDPAAVARSLGPPPLPGHDVIAEHYFETVYDRAVMLAGAVATAGGLITPDELAEELED